MDKPLIKELTAAEKRYSEALVYAHLHDIDIDSLTDIHYKRMIEIAAGINKKKNG